MKNKKSKKTKALAVKQDGNQLVWAGAQDLMKQGDLALDSFKKNSINLVAHALKISPFGVNLLGGLPYLNNLGLKQKHTAYHKNTQFEYQWVQRALTDNDKAICECRIIDAKGKPLTGWITGEASPGTIKVGTIKAYQNHMAQTRSENRAIRNLDAVKIHEELLREIAKIKGVDDKAATEALNAGNTSAEEVVVSEKPKAPEKVYQPLNSNDPVKLAVDFIQRATILPSLKAAEARIKENPEYTTENKKYLLGLVAKRKKEIKK